MTDLAALPRATIISVRDAEGGGKIITVLCPYCGHTHKHRDEVLGERIARCDAAKSYNVKRWRMPHAADPKR